MNGRGGCCIARSAAGAYDNMHKMDQILLRFRPIAPKPTTSPPTEDGRRFVESPRGKRRRARGSSSGKNSGTKRKKCGRKRKTSSPEITASGGSVSGGETRITLSLLPETPDRKESQGYYNKGSSSDNSDVSSTRITAKILPQRSLLDYCLSPAGIEQDEKIREKQTHVVAATAQPSVVGTWVRVESVMLTWSEVVELGSTDEERMVNLGRDSCPGFVSDEINRVLCLNKAYREMEGGGSEVAVWVVMKDGVELPRGVAAFTCIVRVVGWGHGRWKWNTMLPCDVWKMDRGGFAWRLDTNAVLSLGRG